MRSTHYRITIKSLLNYYTIIRVQYYYRVSCLLSITVRELWYNCENVRPYRVCRVNVSDTYGVRRCEQTTFKERLPPPPRPFSQVVPMFVQEGNTVRITMNHYDQTLWGLFAQYARLGDGNQEILFKLSHSNRERNITITNGYWRLLQFEGSFKLPSRKSGALHAPPPLHGQATVSWGYHDSATTMIMSIKPENTDEKWPEQCVTDSPTCLQTASDISTSQIISLQFVNVSIKIKQASCGYTARHRVCSTDR